MESKCCRHPTDRIQGGQERNHLEITSIHKEYTKCTDELDENEDLVDNIHIQGVAAKILDQHHKETRIQDGDNAIMIHRTFL